MSLEPQINLDQLHVRHEWQREDTCVQTNEMQSQAIQRLCTNSQSNEIWWAWQQAVADSDS